MAAPRIPYNELSNDAKVKQKIRKIKPLFKSLPKDRHNFAETLITQFAVCSVTLERLVDEINSGNVIEDFTQGSQKIRRENPALRAYNSAIKSFSAISKNLTDLLPDTAQKKLGDELMEFAMTPVRSSKK